MKSLFAVFVFLTTLLPWLNAQDETWRCATDEMNRLELERSPQARAEREALLQFVDDFLANSPKGDQLYVIPVVFHVVHYYGPENLSKEQLEDQIRILNLDFRKLNADTSYIIDEFKNIATDSRIEFRLAKLDPWGNCTDGVTRTFSYETYNGGEHIKYIAPSWPRAKYLNVWIVNRIPGGVAGYAYYPGTAPDGRDGILIDHAYVGSIGTGSPSRSRTLTHEIGHYLNLPHPWGSTNDPGLPENCDIDDGIEDTPNTIGHTSCALYSNTCGSLDNVQNYMDYSYCGMMFTHGQGAMMRAILNSTVAQRNNLWTEANLIATGVFDEDAIAVCDPVADWGQNIQVACVNTEISYYDLSYNTDTIYVWDWTYVGGNPAESDQKNNVVVYEEPGMFSTSLTVINPAGSDTKSKSNNISVFSHSDGFNLPFETGLEETAFPYINPDVINVFSFINSGDENWQRISSAAATGAYSMRIRNYMNENNISNSFYTPLVVVDTSDFPISVSFNVAYAKSTSTTNDVLRVYYSIDCGKTWMIRYYKSGNSLKTTDAVYASGTFIPNADEWRTESFNINRPSGYQCGTIRLRFESVNKGGNTLYIDDISVKTVETAYSDITKSSSVNVFPNPFSREVYISMPQGQCNISVHDITGRLLCETGFYHTENTRNITSLFHGLATGSYVVTVRHDSGTYTRIVNKQ